MGKDWDRLQGYTANTGFKNFTLPRQRKRNVKCPECGKWLYDHHPRACVCGGVRRLQQSQVEQWHMQWLNEAHRVLQPNGIIKAFSGTRTYHLLAAAMEEAGFIDIRLEAWCYGSGFPKSLNIGHTLEDRKGWGDSPKASVGANISRKEAVNIDLKHGDCIQVLRGMESNSVGNIICDPPYDLVGNSRNGSSQPGDQSTPHGRSGPSKSKGFMGKEWDGTGIAFGQELWGEIYRVLKPNGVVKAFGGTRTFHKMAQAMATSGLGDLRVEAWCYGSGFPKSYNIGKNIEATVLYGGSSPKQIADARAASGQEDLTEGEVRHEFDRDEWAGTGSGRYRNKPGGKWSVTTEEAKPWEGWGTALKPAWEPVIVGRKP